MGHWIECKKCKKMHRYDSDEIVSIGTLWHPIWIVKCRSCGSTIKLDMKSTENVPKSRLTAKLDWYTRVKKGDIREYWAQEYVKNNYKKLGFSEIQRPFEVGPDFKGIYKGKYVAVEVEKTYRSFITHGHHKDQRFKNCVLILLSDSKPPRDIKKKLPKTIIYIDIDHFIKWWRPEARAYARAKRPENIINRIAEELQRRFVVICDEKDRELSTCPECDLCPYFGGGDYLASEVFKEMALKFLDLYKHPITSDDLKLTDIDPHDINKFFIKHVSFFIVKSKLHQ